MEKDKLETAFAEIVKHADLFTAFDNNMIELYYQLNMLEYVFDNLKSTADSITEVHKNIKKITEIHKGN